MKIRIFALMLAILMLSLSACGKGDALYENDIFANSDSESDGESEDTTMQTEIIDENVVKEIELSIVDSIDIDKLLARPYTEYVPTAFSEGLFSTYSQGWGFKNGTVLATGNADGFGLPIDIKVAGQAILPTEATWMPSHVSSKFDSSKYYQNIASEASVSASYTSQYDEKGIEHLTDGVISYADSPRNRWSNYANPARTQNEYITFDFLSTVTCAYFTVHFYDDEGNTRLPKNVSVEYYNGSNWTSAKNIACGAISKNTGVEVRFDEIKADSIRLVLTPQSGKAVGITEAKLFGKSDNTVLIPDGIIIEEKKFITQDDVVVCYISLENKTSNDVSFEISSSPNKGMSEESFGHRYILFGTTSGNATKKFSLSAGDSMVYKLAVAVSDKKGESQSKISSVISSADIVDEHIEQFNLWFEENIPYFDCDDEQILQIYYFRWLTYRNNIRKITEDWNGYIISEFLPNVWWAGLYNSISCPAGQHFYEGRWIRDEKYLDSYQEFWFIDGANPRLYSFAIADAYYNRYLVTGNKQELTKYLNDLIKNYEGWESSHYVSSVGLFTQIADRDGMENGIGGDGIRTTINSYMYGDAMAIYNIALMLNNKSIANEYKLKADALRKNIMNKLWNENEAFFETITADGKFVNVRELIGYVPWYFNIPTDDKKYSVAFAQLLDSEGFFAEYGPTTAERRDPKFMSVIRPNCRWDGPSWPFATSQTLVASANLLNNYKQNNSFDKGDWYDLLKTYAKSQYKNGYPWIAENIHPLTGEWIVDYERSIHYNHSSYTDLVITGLAGIRPCDDDKNLVVNPLFEKGDVKYFMLEKVSYRGHDITVVYDESGEHYDLGKGLMVYVDGTLSAYSSKITSLNVKLK